MTSTKIELTPQALGVITACLGRVKKDSGLNTFELFVYFDMLTGESVEAWHYYNEAYSKLEFS